MDPRWPPNVKMYRDEHGEVRVRNFANAMSHTVNDDESPGKEPAVNLIEQALSDGWRFTR